MRRTRVNNADAAAFGVLFYFRCLPLPRAAATTFAYLPTLWCLATAFAAPLFGRASYDWRIAFWRDAVHAAQRTLVRLLLRTLTAPPLPAHRRVHCVQRVTPVRTGGTLPCSRAIAYAACRSRLATSLPPAYMRWSLPILTVYRQFWTLFKPARVERSYAGYRARRIM